MLYLFIKRTVLTLIRFYKMILLHSSVSSGLNKLETRNLFSFLFGPMSLWFNDHLTKVLFNFGSDSIHVTGSQILVEYGCHFLLFQNYKCNWNCKSVSPQTEVPVILHFFMNMILKCWHVSTGVVPGLNLCDAIDSVLINQKFSGLRLVWLELGSTCPHLHGFQDHCTFLPSDLIKC